MGVDSAVEQVDNAELFPDTLRSLNLPSLHSPIISKPKRENDTDFPEPVLLRLVSRLSFCGDAVFCRPLSPEQRGGNWHDNWDESIL